MNPYVKKKYKWVISCSILLCVFLFNGCKDYEEEPEEDRYPLLEGIWSTNAAGTATRINIYQGDAHFLSFGQDRWKDMADEGYIREWDTYFVNIQYQGEGDFSCQYYDYKSSPRLNDAALNLSPDGTIFIFRTGNEEVTWYKQSSFPVRRGGIYFWTGSDRGNGYITIKLYDSNYNFDYTPFNAEGYYDEYEYERYETEHLIDSRSLIYYVPSGYPGCGGNGSYGFSGLTHGQYKYRANDRINRWTGTVYLNSDCHLIEIK